MENGSAQGGSLGFNYQEIDVLRRSIACDYFNVGEKIAEGWLLVNNAINTNWVGPDAVSIEAEIAKKVCEIYLGTKDNIDQMIAHIAALGETWKTMQSQNTFKEGVGEEAVLVDIKSDNYTFEEVTVTPFDVNSAITGQVPISQPGGSFRGLIDGMSSGNAVVTAVTDYIESIKTLFKNMFSGDNSLTSAAPAFLGGEQATKIDENLNSIIAYISNGLDPIKTKLNEAIAQLATNYETQAANVAESKLEISSETSTPTQ